MGSHRHDPRLIPAALDLDGAGSADPGTLTVWPAAPVGGLSDGVELVWQGPTRAGPVVLHLNSAQAELLTDQLIATRGRLDVPDGEDHVPLPTQPQSPGLSARQVQLLRLVARGLTNKQIAQQTGLADATVKTYLHNAMSRLEARTRTRAVLVAQRRGLL